MPHLKHRGVAWRSIYGCSGFYVNCWMRIFLFSSRHSPPKLNWKIHQRLMNWFCSHNYGGELILWLWVCFNFFIYKIFKTVNYEFKILFYRYLSMDKKMNFDLIFFLLYHWTLTIFERHKMQWYFQFSIPLGAHNFMNLYTG